MFMPPVAPKVTVLVDGENFLQDFLKLRGKPRDIVSVFDNVLKRFYLNYSDVKLKLYLPARWNGRRDVVGLCIDTLTRSNHFTVKWIVGIEGDEAVDKAIIADIKTPARNQTVLLFSGDHCYAPHLIPRNTIIIASREQINHIYFNNGYEVVPLENLIRP